MKFRRPFFFSILIAAFLVAAYYPKIDNAEKEAVLMHTILNGLNQLHYSPKSLDDDFSNRLYELYLERIDGGRRFLTQSDVSQLSVYKDQLDDEALEGSYTFFDLSIKLLDASLKKTQNYYREILDSPFDYDIKETVELDGDKR